MIVSVLLGRLARRLGERAAFREVLARARCYGMTEGSVAELRRQATRMAREFPEVGDRVHHAELMLADWVRVFGRG